MNALFNLEAKLFQGSHWGGVDMPQPHLEFNRPGSMWSARLCGVPRDGDAPFLASRPMRTLHNCRPAKILCDADLASSTENPHARNNT